MLHMVVWWLQKANSMDQPVRTTGIFVVLTCCGNSRVDWHVKIIDSVEQLAPTTVHSCMVHN